MTMSGRTILRSAATLLRSVTSTSTSHAIDPCGVIMLQYRDATSRLYSNDAANSQAASKASAPRVQGEPAAHASSSTGTNPADASTGMDDLPGWLKGPQKRQTTALAEEWVEALHPSTGERCWRSNITGEYSMPGTPKPHTWHQVVDKRSGLLYYWCPATGETTTLGEPKPGPHGRSPAYSQEDMSDSKSKEEKEPLTLVSLYNNPLGYLLLGMAAFGILVQNWPSS